MLNLSWWWIHLLWYCVNAVMTIWASHTRIPSKYVNQANLFEKSSFNLLSKLHLSPPYIPYYFSTFEKPTSLEKQEIEWQGRSVSLKQTWQANFTIMTPLFKYSTVLEEIWKKTFRGFRYVFFPLSSSRCNNISFGLPVCDIPTGACWRRRTGAHQEKVLHSKWKLVRFCFGRLREALVFFRCCYGHDERPCDVDMVLEWVNTWGAGMVEKNSGILHNWKVKSPLAGMTWTFLHPPDVLIRDFISLFLSSDSNADWYQFYLTKTK